MAKAIFIDRDGTIGGDTEAIYPQEFQLYDHALDCIEKLKHAGYLVIAFTNQPDISEGKVTQKEFETELFQFGFHDVCICPHHQSEHCSCRKPGTYMIETMVEKYGLDPSKCYVIGDRWSDMLAGINAGLKIVLVTTGCGEQALNQYANSWDILKASYIASDIAAAANWIISHDYQHTLS